MGQINAAVTQLSQTTQQNASSSEELAATAEEMSGQAEQLQQTMSFFKLAGAAQRGGAQPRGKPQAKRPRAKRRGSAQARRRASRQSRRRLAATRPTKRNSPGSEEATNMNALVLHRASRSARPRWRAGARSRPST